jgi:hypothetical protein
LRGEYNKGHTGICMVSSVIIHMRVQVRVRDIESCITLGSVRVV